MPDINQLWSADIVVSSSGDLATIDGNTLTLQRIIRRLMTRGYQAQGVNLPAEVGEYIFHPEYGAGVEQRVGGALDINVIRSVINRQLFKEQTVAKTPPPVITLTPFLNGVTVSILYYNTASGQQQLLSFDVNQ